MSRWIRRHRTLAVIGVGVGALALVAGPAAIASAPTAASPPHLPELDLHQLVDMPTWLGLGPEPPWRAAARQLADRLGDSPARLAPWVQMIWDEATHYGRDPYFDLSVVLLESNFDPYSTSPAGACGLYQLMPDTAADVSAALQAGEVTAERLYDPQFNIRLGAYYLDQLHRQYGDWAMALTAYNMGEGGLQRHLAAYGTAESAYSRRVFELWSELRQASAAGSGHAQ